jgi:PilZ domain
MERRATRRFRMKLPMRVRWATKSGNGEAQTESEDITSRGVYFVLPTEIDNGSWVELVLVLPHEITLAEPVRARCQARVRRTEIKEMDRVGVAAEIELYQFLHEDKNTGSRASNSKRQEAETKRSSAERVTVKPATKWGGLCERVVKLQDGESIVLDCDGNAAEEAQKVRNGLNGITACDLVRRSVKVVGGKIVITRAGTRRTLSVF